MVIHLHTKMMKTSACFLGLDSSWKEEKNGEVKNKWFSRNIANSITEEWWLRRTAAERDQAVTGNAPSLEDCRGKPAAEEKQSVSSKVLLFHSLNFG